MKRFVNSFWMRLLVALLLIVVFRGVLYRQMVSYQIVVPRKQYKITDAALTKHIEGSVQQDLPQDVEAIVRQSSDITAASLRFAYGNAESDPNRLVSTQQANCIGYAAFMAAVFNYLSKKSEVGRTWIAQPVVAKIYFLGINVHPYFDRPFFRDHDIVQITNTLTGEAYYCDPSLYDYCGINEVTRKK